MNFSRNPAAAITLFTVDMVVTLVSIVPDRRGAVMVEFAIVMSTFFLLMFAVFAAGLDGFYQQVLDDAVRDATRQLQIGAQASSSSSNFVSAICAEVGVLDSGCQSSLTYAVQASTVAGGFSSITPQALSAAGKYNNSFFTGSPFAPGVPILVQVAYPLPFSFPFVGNALTWTNTASIVATAAVRAEPYQ